MFFEDQHSEWLDPLSNDGVTLELGKISSSVLQRLVLEVAGQMLHPLNDGAPSPDLHGDEVEDESVCCLRQLSCLADPKPFHLRKLQRVLSSTYELPWPYFWPLPLEPLKGLISIPVSPAMSFPGTWDRISLTVPGTHGLRLGAVTRRSFFY